MRNIIALLLSLLLAISATAQKSSLAVGCRPGPAGKLIVQLKFLFPDKVVSDKSINIFRQTSNAGEWKKINTAPVSRASADEANNDEDYKGYVTIEKHKPAANPQDENNALAIAGLMILDNNKLARYAGCYFEDADVVAGTDYRYRITDAAKGDVELAASQPFTVKEHYLPVVSNIVLAQKRQDVLLDWAGSEKLFAYNIYRKTTATGKAVKLTEDAVMLTRASGKGIKDVQTTKYTDSALPAGSTFYYELTGVDVLGNESQPSPAISIAIKDMVPPETVANLRAKKNDKNAVLSWKAPATKDLKGYYIYRNSNADTSYKKMPIAMLAKNATAYTDKDMPEGGIYGYIIESVDEAGNIARSMPVKVSFPDKTPPAKPVGLKAVSRPGTVVLTWAANKEADLRGYYIYRSSSRNREYFTQLYKEPVTTNSFTDTLPSVARNEFVYYVQAVDKSYNIGEPSDTVITMLPDITPPHAPQIKEIAYSKGRIALRWQATDDDVTGFDVYRADGDDANRAYKKILTQAGNAYSDSVGRNDMNYTYYVIAFDKAGNRSGPSVKSAAYATADTIAVLPAANITATFSARDTAVTLSWRNPAGNLRGSMVYRRLAGDERFGAVSAAVSAGSTFTDNTVEPGKTYSYMVRSFYQDSGRSVNSKDVTVETR